MPFFFVRGISETADVYKTYRPARFFSLFHAKSKPAGTIAKDLPERFPKEIEVEVVGREECGRAQALLNQEICAASLKTVFKPVLYYFVITS